MRYVMMIHSSLGSRVGVGGLYIVWEAWGIYLGAGGQEFPGAHFPSGRRHDG